MRKFVRPVFYETSWVRPPETAVQRIINHKYVYMIQNLLFGHNTEGIIVNENGEELTDRVIEAITDDEGKLCFGTSPMGLFKGEYSFYVSEIPVMEYSKLQRGGSCVTVSISDEFGQKIMLPTERFRIIGKYTKTAQKPHKIRTKSRY